MSDNRSRKKRKSNASYVLEILLCLIALTAIIFAMLFLVRSHNLEDRVNELQDRIDIYEDPADPYIPTSRAEAMILDQKDENYAVAYNEGRYKLLNDMKQTLLDSDSVLKTFQKFYPDDLIIYYEGDYLFYPISQQLRHHTYDNSLFNSLDNGRIAYVSSDVSTETWIDVSKFQGKVKWSEVAKDGIDGTMIRIGYRGYSKGDIMMDDTFEDNIEGALKNDLQAGVYFLSQAISEEEAVEEAEYVIEILQDYEITGPVALDIELVGGDDGRGNALSMEERTRYSIAFLERIKKADYDPLIYGNLKSFLIMLDLEKLEDYPKWFASYDDEPYWPYEMDYWQYTEKGRVDGIDGDVDLNIKFIKE
ncbi:MAG: hypothetical protein IJ058_08445 [Lachnospiraceae bacterium]|nr:hypothetical protein [Lachnospiraceae bacterium]